VCLPVRLWSSSCACGVHVTSFTAGGHVGADSKVLSVQMHALSAGGAHSVPWWWWDRERTLALRLPLA